ncbi:AzlC family ABC transporter permease [Marivibrio halodurans]|uniref:AzlC family ABC transporter permease n=1 Tax=Marivibrio halodurans TaxID=2039722 RepID=A0A8J7V4N2_9PROT|nr:AzlC family ABC transporter permease [Marivibrio halodurans]MBP5857869.1 AzlC family ABC transporter permease [Marivibrio halodurans]
MRDTPSSPAAASFASEARRGLIDILPLLLGAVPFAMLCGALAAQKGLSPAELGLMSAAVYAGGAQFIAIEMWASPTPVLAVVATTLLVNARHVLMGAAIAPHLRHLPGPVRALYITILTDESWAVGMRRATRGVGLSPGYVLGMIVPFYLQWPAAGVIGCLFGGLVRDPARIGADFVFTAVFLCLVVGLWRGRHSTAPVLAAAASATLVHLAVPGVWYIFAGALAGTLAGALTAPRTAGETRDDG